MNKHVELPLAEPVYSTYHYQGSGAAVALNNPTARNWYLNEVMNLKCSRKFLSGFTTPEITVVSSSWMANPYIDRCWLPTQFMGGYIYPVIRKMLDKGFYVVFGGIDDYYVKGKSWYHKRHFEHDGLICGYDQADKTYCIYAYDSNWRYRKFWTPQRAFDTGRLSMEKQGVCSSICGIKVKRDTVAFSPETVYAKLMEYLDSNLEKYPFDGEKNVYGIVVHTYIAAYVMKLYEGDIPYERMDYRIFRVIWEQKKMMLERIALIEQTLDFDHTISKAYTPIVKEADTMRMLYAAHHMKRRDSVLPIISKKLLSMEEKEREVLTAFAEKMGKERQNEAVDISEK